MINIFEILASADKELVHSSMIKFFLDYDHLGDDFVTNFIGISNLQSRGEIKLEQSYKNHSTGERVRFDLLCTSSKDGMTPIMIIENKFKSTVSIKQLELYDNYLETHDNKNAVKVLFVFSPDQVLGDVHTYCVNNNWKVYSYVPGSSRFTKIKDLVSWLNDVKNKPGLDQKSEILVNDYFDYLESFALIIKDYISNHNFKEFNKSSDRFIYFQYLLYIQQRIIKEFDAKGIKNIIPSHDGGKNVIPGIAFWMPVKNKLGVNSAFSAIDGNSFKLGISYQKKENKFVSNFITELRNNWKTKNLKTLLLKENNRNLKSLNETNERKQESVYSIFTFKIQENESLSSLISEITEISADYFKNYLKC